MLMNLLDPKLSRASQRPGLSAGPRLWIKRSWILLFLTSSIFSTCFLAIQAVDVNMAIHLVPLYPVLGEDVNIIPAGNMENVQSCSWFRGAADSKNQIVIFQPSPNASHHFKDAYTGRETVNANCSLHITNLTLLDTGYYIMHKERKAPKADEQEKIFLLVGEKSGDSQWSRVLSAKITAGIVISCLSAFLAIVGLISYQTLKAYERIEPADTATILT